MKMILEIYFNNTIEALEKSKTFPYKSIFLTMDKKSISEPMDPFARDETNEFDSNVKEIFTILGNDLKILKIKKLSRILPMLFLSTPNLISLNLENVDAEVRQLRNYLNEDSGPGMPRRDLFQHGDQGYPFLRREQDQHEFHQMMHRLMNQDNPMDRNENLNFQDPLRFLYGNIRPDPPQPIIIPQYRRRNASINLLDLNLPQRVGPGLQHHRPLFIMPRHMLLGQDQRHHPISKSDLLRLFPNVPIISLKHLKFLEIKSVRKVLCWIEAPNLKTFIVHDALNCDGIKELLVTTEKLEKLVMDQFVASKFENLENFKFQLKKLEINCIDEAQLTDKNEKFMYNFIKFLKSQKQSLHDLTMTFHTVHPDVANLISFINNNLKLSNFSIKFKLDNPIDTSTTTTNSVKNIVSGYLTNLYKFQNIISNCEQITSLDMNFNMLVETEVLNHLAVSMPKLKSLSLHPFFTKVSSSTVFENLESLKITKLREGPHTATWYEIALTCPNIKELTLIDEFFEISPMKLKLVLQNAKNLKILNFTGLSRFVITEEFLKVFLDDSTKLQRINFHANMNQDEFHEKMKILTKNSKIQTILHPI